MAQLLLNLRDVPEDEADEVRAMLDSLQLAWYETQPSRWGISSGGIWVGDSEQYQQARSAMDQYQRQRVERMREQRRSDELAGVAPTLLDTLRANPLNTIASVLAIALLLGLMAMLPLALLAK